MKSGKGEVSAKIWRFLMFIDVDCYEELYLKGKDRKTVIAEVEKMRSAIDRIKLKMESPLYAYDDRVRYPSETLNIDICRKYLAAAIKYAESEFGETDLLTEEEKAASYVEGLNSKITALNLTIGHYFENTYRLELSGDRARLVSHNRDGEESEETADAARAREVIENLRLGEWKSTYMPENYGCNLSEPVKWQLRVEYCDGIAPRFFDGAGVFPYNFSLVAKLLGAEY